RFEQIDRAADVVAEVARRLAHRFADVCECREVQHGADAVVLQRAAQKPEISEVALHERTPAYGGAVPARQIVERDGQETRLRQCLASMAAYISRSPRDEHPHQRILPIWSTLDF